MSPSARDGPRVRTRGLVAGGVLDHDHDVQREALRFAQLRTTPAATSALALILIVTPPWVSAWSLSFAGCRTVTLGSPPPSCAPGGPPHVGVSPLETSSFSLPGEPFAEIR